MANGASKGNLILIACAVATLVLDARRDKREEAERRQEYVAVVEVPQDASGEREDGLVDFRNEPILGSEREDAHVDFTKRPYYGGGRVSDMLLPDPEGHPDESFDFRKCTIHYVGDVCVGNPPTTIRRQSEDGRVDFTRLTPPS